MLPTVYRMKNPIKLAAILFIAVLAPGCGGGGSGGGAASAPAASGSGNTATSTTSSASASDGSWLSFDPGAPSVTQYEGESVPVTVTATSSRTFAATFNIGIVDGSGVITSQVSVAASPTSPSSYIATLNTVAGLGVGPHTTSLEVRVCEDAPLVCAKPFPGSPWRLPLTVNVRSNTKLSTLTPIDGLAGWSTFKGNAAHTGYVDASFDPAAFTRRWRLAASSTYPNIYPSVAIDGERVFFTRLTMNSEAQLVAVAEDTGEPAWIANLGSGLIGTGSPAASNGRVYVTATRGTSSLFWVYDQAKGTMLKQIASGTQLDRSSAPTVYGTDVYAFTGYATLAKYSDQSGKLAWNASVSSLAGWTPATDGRFLYTFNLADGTLAAFDAGDGSLAYSIGQAASASAYPEAGQVALAGTQAFVAAGKLIAFDLAGRTRAWATSTDVYGNAAYANGTVYAFGSGGTTLEARSATTGALSWSLALGGGGYFSDVIVTRNLAFVSSNNSTQAVDLATHKLVWTYPMGGSLAISPRGVLYIADALGALAAVNLR